MFPFASSSCGKEKTETKQQKRALLVTLALCLLHLLVSSNQIAIQVLRTFIIQRKGKNKKKSIFAHVCTN